jgi:hypothetical protein
MWNRTKRLINSYLDDLIDRSERPDGEVRDVTRSELARLNELEVNHRANAKMLERQIAEIELKMAGVAERDKILQRQGQPTSPSDSALQLSALDEQRTMLVKQLAEANSAAERAKALRSDRAATGEELAAQTHLTAMGENLASIQSAFGVNDPAAVIDEMRSRIARKGTATSEAQNLAADADRELAREVKRASVEDMLSQYKQSIGGPEMNPPPSGSMPGPTIQNQPKPTQAVIPDQPSQQNQAQDQSDAPQTKTLGRADGPIRPID